MELLEAPVLSHTVSRPVGSTFALLTYRGCFAATSQTGFCAGYTLYSVGPIQPAGTRAIAAILGFQVDFGSSWAAAQTLFACPANVLMLSLTC